MTKKNEQLATLQTFWAMSKLYLKELNKKINNKTSICSLR